MTTTTRNARIVQVNVSPGGVPKLPVQRAWLDVEGLEGDGHRAPGHGGPLRAVSLWSLERIKALRAEGHPVFPGAAGENLTISGLEWAELEPGQRLRLGAAVVELTRYVVPCKNVAYAFTDGDFPRIHQDAHPGWARLYARVLVPGMVAVGDPVEFVSADAEVGASA